MANMRMIKLIRLFLNDDQGSNPAAFSRLNDLNDLTVKINIALRKINDLIGIQVLQG